MASTRPSSSKSWATPWYATCPRTCASACSWTKTSYRAKLNRTMMAATTARYHRVRCRRAALNIAGYGAQGTADPAHGVQKGCVKGRVALPCGFDAIKREVCRPLTGRALWSPREHADHDLQHRPITGAHSQAVPVFIHLMS